MGSNAHDFYVVADGGNMGASVGRSERFFRSENSPFKVGPRGETRADGCVVGERNTVCGVSAVEFCQIGRAGPKMGVDLNVVAEIEIAHVFGQHLATGGDGQLIHGESVVFGLRGYPTGEVNFNGMIHPAPSERRLRGATAEENFVDVVVEDGACFLKVSAAEFGADPLGDRVAKSVGVALAFAFNNFDGTAIGSGSIHAADHEFHSQRSSCRVFHGAFGRAMKSSRGRRVDGGRPMRRACGDRNAAAFRAPGTTLRRVIVAKRLLTTVDHAPDVVDLTYVYPVVSRRAGGVSIGVNLNPNNACNWKCAYCQVEGLVLGAGPKIDLEKLEHELRVMLHDVLLGDFLARSAPEGARVLKDIAFAGNGEPTTSPDFRASVEVVGRVLGDAGLLGTLPVVLITNGTQTKKADVAEGLKALASIGGQVWFKFDSATDEAMRRVNQAPGDVYTHVAKLRVAASLCPTWIQTCLVAWDGLPPSEDEQTAYLSIIETLVKEGVSIRGVLLYSAARKSAQPESVHISALSEAWLRAFASRIEAAGLHVKVTP